MQWLSAWSTSCAQERSAAVSAPRSSSRARRSPSSRVQRPSSSSASTSFRPLPRRAEVDLVAPEDGLGRAVDLHGHAGHEALDALHRVRVVRVRLVPLQHGELGLVLVGHAFVAEVLAQLVDLLQPSDDEALEVELGGDAEVEVGVERVRVGHERLRESAAVARLQGRRLHLEEARVVEVPADRGDDRAAQDEVAAGVLVDEQVQVTLAVARLGVHEAVVRVRKRPGRLGQEHELVDCERRLSAPRLRRPADDADDVPEVEVDRARPVGGAEQLDLARPVGDVEEDELPVPAPSQYPAGDPARLGAFLPGREWLSLRAHGGDLVAVGEALGQGHQAASLVRVLPGGRERRRMDEAAARPL